METIILNAHDYPALAYTVFFDRAEAKREFTGIQLTVHPPSTQKSNSNRKVSMKLSSKTFLRHYKKNT